MKAYVVGVVSAVVMAVFAACGPGASCAKDADCKGARVCKAGECVDTSGAGAGSSGAGSAGAGSSGAGTSGSGGGSSSGGMCDGKDTDCPTGSWCNQGTCQATTKKRVAESCSQSSECAGAGCLFKRPGVDVVGYCTKQCDSFTECPTFWDCKDVSNGGGKYCVQN